jgi:hypothetical protein
MTTMGEVEGEMVMVWNKNSRGVYQGIFFCHKLSVFRKNNIWVSYWLCCNLKLSIWNKKHKLA